MKPLLHPACMAGMILVAASANAQLANPVLPQIDPGRVQDRLQPPLLPPPAPEIVAPEVPENIAPEAAARTRITVSSIRIEGSTVYPEGAFADLTAPLIGHEISLADAFRLADAVTARYRRDDYVLSRAVVPAQRIANGVLRIQVVEGFVSKVAFGGRGSARLRGYAAHLTAERPLCGKTLERYLLLMNDLPGVTVRAVLAPSPDETGGSLLTIVDKRKAVDGYAGFDNHGSRYIGPFEYYAGVAINDALGLGERLALNYAGAAPASELQYFSAQGDFPIGSNGLSLTVNGGHSRSHPGFVLKDLHTVARGTSAAAQLSYPLIRSRADTLRLSLGFRYLDSRTIMNDDAALPPSSNDHIRSLRLGVLYDFADRLGGRNIVDVQLTRGLGVLGSLDNFRPNPSRPNARNQFTKLTIEASRRQSLAAVLPGLGLYGVVTAQTSFGDPLLSSEQFGVGGSVIGTAYDPSEITGDAGASGRVELQYAAAIRALRGVAQVYGFYDRGTTHDVASQSGEPRDRSLASAGGGVRFSLIQRVSAFAEVAKPLSRPVQTRVLAGESPHPVRVFVGMTVRY